MLPPITVTVCTLLQVTYFIYFSFNSEDIDSFILALGNN